MKLNWKTKEFSIEPVKWQLKLKNHQGIVRINEELIMFAGGVNHSFNWVENVCFTYNIFT